MSLLYDVEFVRFKVHHHVSLKLVKLQNSNFIHILLMLLAIIFIYIYPWYYSSHQCSQKKKQKVTLRHHKISEYFETL